MKLNRDSLPLQLAAGAALFTPVLAMATDDDAISSAITGMGGLSSSVSGGAAAVIAVAMVFVGIKLGKRLLGKV